MASLTFRVVGRKAFLEYYGVDTHTRDENGGGTKSFDFRSDHRAMTVNYMGTVTLADSFLNNIIHFSFGIHIF